MLSPTPRLKPLGDAEWDVAGKWRLQAAGAVARSDPEMAKALRVSELFEVRPKDGGDLAAAVRVVTIWRESSAEGAEQLQESLKEMGEAEKGRNLLQAVQIVSLLPEPASSTENNFASVTTRFVYSPIRVSPIPANFGTELVAAPGVSLMPARWAKKKWQGDGQDDWQDQLSAAVTQALEPIIALETEWDQAKLEKRIKQYLRNAAKNLDFQTKPWHELIEEFADQVFSSIFQALKERSWLPQVDFLMVIDAAVKELFPPYLLQSVPQQLFEQQVLHAHDRAFEEQRFAPMLWDVLFDKVEDKVVKNKIYNAFEAGRKEAAMVSSEGDPVEEFIKAWVACSLRELQGSVPEEALPRELCRNLFHELYEAGALPLPLTQEGGTPPDGILHVDQAIEDFSEGKLQAPPSKGLAKAKKPKAALPSPSQAWSASLPPVHVAPVRPAYPTPSLAPSKGGKAPSFGKGGNGFNVFAGQKRPLDSPGNGKGKVSQPFAAKRPKPAPMLKAVGHPLCTQQEDCVGDAASALVQHVDDDVPGDIYCSACWAIFADADETLNAIPFEA
ncbi:unnamed protein product [Effrenium voratum]|uniref:Uncharacterized protein n=1 Tax=Effrenium voratum TaxID=2562239 RepID=A0AA36N0H1_9DINO|nr:unnamed protein product [Effrenium voratum]